MNPAYGLPLIVLLLFALLAVRRAASARRMRGQRPRRAKLKPASVRMSARTEMRALDDAFTVMGPTTRPEKPRAEARASARGRAKRADATPWR